VVKASLIPYSKLAKVCESLKETYFNHEAVPKKKIPDIVDDAMSQLRRVFKRRYRLFEFTGAANADVVVVSLCSQQETAALSYAVGRAAANGQRVGLLQVRMLRPWSARHFLQALPLARLKRCVVVVGAQQDPSSANILFADVVGSVPLGHGVQIVSSSFAGTIGAAEATDLLSRMSGSAVDSSSHLAIPCSELSSVGPKLRADIKKIITWAKVTPYLHHSSITPAPLQHHSNIILTSFQHHSNIILTLFQHHSNIVVTPV
jgi:hypothetical protein